MKCFPYSELWVQEKVSSEAYSTPYKFTGKEQDAETGLYYYGARYYDAQLSRWISADPARQHMNLYMFNRSNPVKFIDPDGRMDIDVHASKYGPAMTDGEGNFAHLPMTQPSRTSPSGNIGSTAKSTSNSSLQAIKSNDLAWNTNIVNNINNTSHSTGLSGSDIASNASSGLTYLGIGAGTVELGFQGLGIGNIGSNLKIYSQNFHGNQYVSKLFSVGQGIKASSILGKGFGLFNIGADYYLMSNNAMSKTRFGVNTGINAIGFVSPMTYIPVAGMNMMYGDGIAEFIDKAPEVYAEEVNRAAANIIHRQYNRTGYREFSIIDMILGR